MMMKEKRRENNNKNRFITNLAILIVVALVTNILMYSPIHVSAAPKKTVSYEPLRYVDIECNTALKAGSGDSYDTIGNIPESTRIYSYGYDRYDANTAWYKVTYNGTVGYINADDCHLSYQAYSPQKTGQTTANMYMRSGVGLDYTKKKYIKSGSLITLHGYYRTEGYDWYKITYNGITGYVSSKYVKRIENMPKTTVTYNPLRYVDVETNTIFKNGSSASASELGTIPEGTRIYSYGYDRYDANTAWYKVAYDGTVGYINADDCHLSYQAYTPVRTGKTTANMYMRSGVGLDYTKKTYIKSGSSITLYGYYRTEGYDWYKIKYNGKTGYVSSKYVNRLEIPNVKADFGNLSATISWDKLDGATKYKVYRKLGPNGTFRLLGETTDTTYRDVYVQWAKTESEKNYLCASVFVDPSINPYSYTVKACYVEDGKETYSDYLKDGVCHIETPSIVSVDKISNTTATIEWSTLKNATSYLIYTGVKDDNGVHWTEVKEVKHKSATRQKETITVNADHTYYTIKAKFVRDGKTVYSDFDQNFTIENRNYQDKNILYIGDSITFGSPYKGATTVEVFSYPWRVQQLTGVKMYNPSIPGATYAYKDDKCRDRLVEDVAVPMNEGRTPYKALHKKKKKQKGYVIMI